MRVSTRHVGLSMVLGASLITLALAVQASEPKEDAVDKVKVEEVVQESQQGDPGETDAATDVDKHSEVGEASYNVENCEALIDESEENGSSAPGVEKLDLDKCKQLVK